MTPSPRTVLLTVGTDYHPFSRAVDWLDRWLERHPEHRSTTVVQHGTSRPSRYAVNHDYLAHDELQRLLDEVSVVVAHGGPATIFEAVEHGHLPICLPRDPRLGEHVDGHQQRFSRYLAHEGVVRLAQDSDDFARTVDTILERGRGEVDRSRLAHRAQTLSSLAELVTSAIERDRPSRLGGRRRSQRFGLAGWLRRR